MDEMAQSMEGTQISPGAFHTFAIETRGDSFSGQLEQQLIRKLKALGLSYNEPKPDLVLSIGGDGTLLQAFHRYTDRLSHTAFVGVHTGHLGFYADWTVDEIPNLIQAIADRKCTIVQYPLLRVTVTYRDKPGTTVLLALNECTVRGVNNLLVSDVYVKKEFFESFRGDGLCFSTPTGSTAYNKGLSGAIVHPSLASIQLTEIASINNRVFRTIGSSLILPQHHSCQIRPVDDSRFNISIDNLSTVQERVKTIECSVAREKISFARFRTFPFWRRVRDSFIG